MAHFVRFVSYVMVLAIIVLGGVMLGPGLPPDYNPFAPLDPVAKPSVLTPLKLTLATRSVESCLGVLDTVPDIRFAALQDRSVTEQCHIRGHTRVRALSEAYLTPVSTRCEIALRLYMWERHVVQPSAQALLGTNVTEIGHLDSFSCRPIRTTEGEGDSMSAHATASAIDIGSVTLANGLRLSLAGGWTADDPRIRTFWRTLRTGACDYFRTVLSPDFNTLHADHFHLAQGQYGACR